LWRYRVFGVFEKLRGDKGFLGALRPVSFSSFGNLPSTSGSVHCPNQLLDRTSPCCPAPYPFLLLPLTPPHFSHFHQPISPQNPIDPISVLKPSFMAFIRAYPRLRALSRSLAIRICAFPPIFRPIFAPSLYLVAL
jgi:hypothetical protein